MNADISHAFKLTGKYTKIVIKFHTEFLLRMPKIIEMD